MGMLRHTWAGAVAINDAGILRSRLDGPDSFLDGEVCLVLE